MTIFRATHKELSMRALIPLLLLASTGAFAQTAPLTPDEAAMRAHVAFLASDEMKGRAPGTPEYDRAAAYVADQMRAAGLQPAGDDGTYLQRVPLASAVPAGKGSLTAVGRPKLIFGSDYLTSTSFLEPDLRRSGEIVFVGRGVVDAANGIDDYAGLDVRGRIVAYLYGAPASLPSEIRAHLGSGDTKRATAAAHGAIGVIQIENTEQTHRYPFSYLMSVYRSPRMTWVGKDGRPQVPGSGAPSIATLSAGGAAKLFTGSTLDWAAVVKADAAGQALPHGATGVRVSTRQRSKVTRFTSSNVVGVLPGSDPTLKGEYVALSAHLDHIGISTDPTLPKGADVINNGAMDNGVGTAAMIEVAKQFAADPRKPRRSLVFVSVTAEEKGLIGSEYFATHPTVPGTIVADVNLDMPILSYRFEDMVAIGADHSTVAQAVARAAGKRGIALSPDPEPEEAIFVRSDHYSFVKAGIPAVSLDTGWKGPGKAAVADFLEHRYHQPGDDMRQTFDWTAGRIFVAINHDIALDLADADARPRWNKGDYFGLLYNGYGAK